MLSKHLPALSLVIFSGIALVSASAAPTNQVTVLEKEGVVEAARANETNWSAAQTNQVLRVADRIRTGERSRAALHLLDQSTMRMAELTEFLIEPLPDASDKPTFNLGRGLLYFFHRDKPVDVQFKTRSATAAIRGTEFHLAVADNGRTVLTMFDGEVKLSNEFGAVELHHGEQGTVEPGQAPTKSPALEMRNIIQWCLYYPGVVDVDELDLDASESSALQSSVTAYRAGDLAAALAEYPAGREPTSAAEKTYLAALLLSVGKVDQAGSLLTNGDPIAAALRELIATVSHTHGTNTALVSTNTATEALILSYQLQAQSRLPEALRAAEQSVARAPQFGFGWARVAELEFSFGHTKPALAALDTSLKLAPRNAQAVALRGFALAAQNRIREASAEFDRAIALDGALGNAWLGRGLCKIRRGQLAEGRTDLQVAATLEPNRALLRSYLAKAWTEQGDSSHAERELALAKERDANDPTAWLYSALLLQQENRINEAVDELERSEDLNDQRQLYRSRLLLDQDRAVRGANLANIYRDAGMTDVSVREAVTAVNADYANYSAHLFLANSYNELRDPQGVNLRYETPYVSEFLVANLLAPVGAGTLSQQVSQQEYSKLFERDRLGLSSSTEYTSHGNWRQSAAQTGRFGNSEFALEEYYNSQHGYRPNSDLEVTEYDARFKQQLTPDDSLLVQATIAESEGGNLAQYYNEADAALSPFRFKEKQEPIVMLGYHHEWNPGSHTLVLGSRLADTYHFTNPSTVTYFEGVDTGAGEVIGILPFAMDQRYASRLEVYSLEVQQIWQARTTTTILGTRFQGGTFDVDETLINTDINFSDIFFGPVIQQTSPDFRRFNAYGYEHWQIADSLRVIGGLSVDWQELPDNFRSAPVASGSFTRSRVLPKAGVIWTPDKDSVIRAAYAKAAGGASIDQSIQLEPTQVAGFNQAFRSLIPETIAGANAGAEFTTYGFAIEHKFPSRTYVALEGLELESKVAREDGAFIFTEAAELFPGSVHEDLKFRETSLTLSAHQLIGRTLALGCAYRISDARLERRFPTIPDAAALGGFQTRQTLAGALQTLDLRAVHQLPCGFFSGVDGSWIHQRNGEALGSLPGDDFWVWNFVAGFQPPGRRLKIEVGVLNFTGRNYHLSPINLYPELPRDRTFFARFSFNL